MSLTAALPLVLVGLSSTFAADSPTVRLPSRVAQEAEVLQQNAARILTRETLVQRALLPPGPRLRVRDTAVRALSESAKRGADRARKPMLQEFARNGLVNATDYSLFLLDFTTRGQRQMDISSSGRCYIGSDPALAFASKQHPAEGGIAEFHSREFVHRALQGTIDQNDNRIRDSSIVTENLYLYDPFQFFSASSTISFGSPK